MVVAFFIIVRELSLLFIWKQVSEGHCLSSNAKLHI